MSGYCDGETANQLPVSDSSRPTSSDRPPGDNVAPTLDGSTHEETHPQPQEPHSALPSPASAPLAPPGCGLVNEGATCYLNSLLQLLFHTHYFRSAVYRVNSGAPAGGDAEPEEGDDGGVPRALQHIFCQLEERQPTAHLKAASTKPLTDAFGWDENQLFYQHDIQELAAKLRDCLEGHMKGTPSEGAINRLFTGHAETYFRCLDGSYTGRSRETFYDIHLQLNPYETLRDSLAALLKTEELVGENKYKVERDGQDPEYKDAERGYRFLSFPPVLLFHLKRFDMDLNSPTLEMMKINSYFDFPLSVDLAEFEKGVPEDFTSGDSKDCCKSMHPTFGAAGARTTAPVYDLYGVIVHRGTVRSGHYFCYMREAVQCDDGAMDWGKWVEFDDESVRFVPEDQAVHRNFGGQTRVQLASGQVVPMMSSQSAYILAYVRRGTLPVVFGRQPAAPIPHDVLDECRRELRREQEERRRAEARRRLLHFHILMPDAVARHVEAHHSVLASLNLHGAKVKTLPRTATLRELLRFVAAELGDDEALLRAADGPEFVSVAEADRRLCCLRLWVLRRAHGGYRVEPDTQDPQVISAGRFNSLDDKLEEVFSRFCKDTQTEEGEFRLAVEAPGLRHTALSAAAPPPLPLARNAIAVATRVSMSSHDDDNGRFDPRCVTRDISVARFSKDDDKPMFSVEWDRRPGCGIGSYPECGAPAVVAGLPDLPCDGFTVEEISFRCVVPKRDYDKRGNYDTLSEPEQELCVRLFRGGDQQAAEQVIVLPRIRTHVAVSFNFRDVNGAGIGGIRRFSICRTRQTRVESPTALGISRVFASVPKGQLRPFAVAAPPRILQPLSKTHVLCFVKFFNPATAAVSYMGTVCIPAVEPVSSSMPLLMHLCGFPASAKPAFILYEECSADHPSDDCLTPVVLSQYPSDLERRFSSGDADPRDRSGAAPDRRLADYNGLRSGCIIVMQPDPRTLPPVYPWRDYIEFLNFQRGQRQVQLRSLEEPSEVLALMRIHNQWSVDKLCLEVGETVGIRGDYVRLFSATRDPEPQPLRMPLRTQDDLPRGSVLFVEHLDVPRLDIESQIELRVALADAHGGRLGPTAAAPPSATSSVTTAVSVGAAPAPLVAQRSLTSEAGRSATGPPARPVGRTLRIPRGATMRELVDQVLVAENFSRDRVPAVDPPLAVRPVGSGDFCEVVRIAPPGAPAGSVTETVHRVLAVVAEIVQAAPPAGAAGVGEDWVVVALHSSTIVGFWPVTRARQDPLDASDVRVARVFNADFQYEVRPWHAPRPGHTVRPFCQGTFDHHRGLHGFFGTPRLLPLDVARSSVQTVATAVALLFDCPLEDVLSRHQVMLHAPTGERHDEVLYFDPPDPEVIVGDFVVHRPKVGFMLNRRRPKGLLSSRYIVSNDPQLVLEKKKRKPNDGAAVPEAQ